MADMKNTVVFYIILIFFLSLNNYAVYGELNIKKSSANVVQNTNMDPVNCVDIYKQPAFDHPKLKNHKIQMKPSFTLEGKLTKALTDAATAGLIPHRGCPPGKVPILRSNVSNVHPLKKSRPGEHVVVFQNKPDNSTYRGVAARINTQNPFLDKYSKEYSAAQIWVQRGPGFHLNSIEAGWAVNPTLYGDTKTRVTAHWTPDGYYTGCYNVLCPGFVQVHEKYYLGGVVANISTWGLDQYALKLAIRQDKSSKHWWLIFGRDIKIGYWPWQLFSYLIDGAKVIRYGGDAQESPEDGHSPPMGNGDYPNADLSESSYFEELEAARDSYELKLIEPHHVYGVIDTIGCYGFVYLGYHNDTTGPSFTYGGPGGFDCGIY